MYIIFRFFSLCPYVTTYLREGQRSVYRWSVLILSHKKMFCETECVFYSLLNYHVLSLNSAVTCSCNIIIHKCIMRKKKKAGGQAVFYNVTFGGSTMLVCVLSMTYCLGLWKQFLNHVLAEIGWSVPKWRSSEWRKVRVIPLRMPIMAVIISVPSVAPTLPKCHTGPTFPFRR